MPKISQVLIKWRRRATQLDKFTSHLRRFTLWPNGRRAKQLDKFTSHLGRFTLWHNGYQVTQPGRFTLWRNGRRATQLGELNCRFDACTGIRRHFSKTVTNHAEKDEGFGWFSNNRSMYALRRFRRWSGCGQNLALGPWASPWATLWATLWATPRKAKK